MGFPEVPFTLNTPGDVSSHGSMKPPLHRLALAILLLCMGVSCTTAYDAQGRPRQVVDPAAALVGVALVGLIAYGIANSDDDDRHQHRCQNSGHGYRGGRRSRY